MRVTPTNYELLGNALDLAQLRHRVVSQNVANVNTPGYRAKEVTFSGELDGRLASGTTPEDALALRIRDAQDAAVRADGNSVDIDKEVGKISKNTVFFQAISQVLASRLATMRSAISGQ